MKSTAAWAISGALATSAATFAHDLFVLAYAGAPGRVIAGAVMAGVALAGLLAILAAPVAALCSFSFSTAVQMASVSPSSRAASSLA